MAFVRSSRAIVRCPMWVATTTSRPRRPWACFAQGPAACGANFSWSDLILERSRKLVGLQSAACATRAGGDSGLNFGNYDPFHAQSPDTGRGVHACSWWVNRDVDVRRWFLGFNLRVHLLALLLDGPYGGEKSQSQDLLPRGCILDITSTFKLHSPGLPRADMTLPPRAD